jgi:precorrin-6Y C5,15-methyltransferase (decarboxylating)
MSGKLTLIGIGMGNPDTLTIAAKSAADEAEVLIGAERLLEAFSGLSAERVPAVRAEEVAEAVRLHEEKNVAVLYSGDTGFYSGAESLYPLLEDRDFDVLPGMSSLQYLCAKAHTAWQDVCCVSVHGREADCAGEMQSRKKVFFLTGGNRHVQDVCRELTDRGMGEFTAFAGERLSYPDERIVRGAVEELAEMTFSDLSVLLVENDRPARAEVALPGLPDEAFLRGGTPMTKAEVRAVCLSKLRLTPSCIVWDVGAGTGSVSVECALTAEKGRVFAVERDGEALSLLEQNREKFGAWNMEIVAGEAPQILEELPKPDRVFVGGSGGNLEEILRAALQKNPVVRIVVTAVTLETLAEAARCFELFELENTEITELSVAKARLAGSYHLMQAHNPVWILSGEGGA